MVPNACIRALLKALQICRRAVVTGRAVRVKSQLQSHKRFATAFNSYCSLVDNARLYSTNTLGVPKVSQLNLVN